MYVTLLTILSCRFSYLGHARTSSRWTHVYALWLKKRVSAQERLFVVRTMGDVIWNEMLLTDNNERTKPKPEIEF